MLDNSEVCIRAVLLVDVPADLTSETAKYYLRGPTIGKCMVLMRHHPLGGSAREFSNFVFWLPEDSLRLKPWILTLMINSVSSQVWKSGSPASTFVIVAAKRRWVLNIFSSHACSSLLLEAMRRQDPMSQGQL